MNHVSADSAVDALVQAQSYVFQLAKEDRINDLQRVKLYQANPEEYAWLEQEFSKTWE